MSLPPPSRPGPLRAPSPSKNRTGEFPRIRLKHLKGRSWIDPAALTGNLCDTTMGDARLWHQPEEGLHRRVGRTTSISLCSPRLRRFPYVLAKRHLSDVGSLACRVTLKPVSAPLQGGLRFFRHPKRAPPSDPKPRDRAPRSRSGGFGLGASQPRFARGRAFRRGRPSSAQRSASGLYYDPSKLPQA